jgi:hypothetical protein
LCNSSTAPKPASRSQSNCDTSGAGVSSYAMQA